ncbi:MAG: hypothetical protein AAGJ08_09295 [Cyanobacteria bacterium P01_H01_bin.35]
MRVSIEVFSQPEAAEVIQIIEQLAYAEENPSENPYSDLESLSSLVRFALISVFDTQKEINRFQLNEFKTALRSLETRVDEYYTILEVE